MGKQFLDSEFETLFRFIGYGNLAAEYWFIGMEEGGGGEANLRARLGYNDVEDCKEAHEKLGITKFHTGNKVIQSTWAGMCRIMLAIEDKDINTENVRAYQAEKLGRKNGNTLLCELMPLPKPSMHDWGYESFFPQFKSIEDYYENIKPRRIDYLRAIIASNNPKIAICYGKKYWDNFKNLFEKRIFEPRGIFSISKGESTTVILSDHFTARSMNGQFASIADLIKRL